MYAIRSYYALPPVFDPQGSITAGNASALSDGAAALLVMSEARARELGLPVLARVRAMTVVGCEPCLMGYGPVPASRLALKRAKLSLADVALVEINEAFAAQVLPCLRDLGLEEQLEDRVNRQGGRHRPGPSAGLLRGAHPHQPGTPVTADRRSIWSRHHVHRSGPGDQHPAGTGVKGEKIHSAESENASVGQIYCPTNHSKLAAGLHFSR